MTRASLLAATALAALATASLPTTDADARNARPAHHSVSHHTSSRPVKHFGPGTRTAHRNAGSHAVAHKSSTRQTFGQRRLAHGTSTVAHQHATNHPGQSHPNVSLNQSHPNVNAGQSQNPGTAHAAPTLASSHAHQGSAQIHTTKTNTQNTLTAHQEQRQLTQAKIRQIQKTAAANRKEGNADIKAANAFRQKALDLQAKARTELDERVKQADLQQAAADMRQASTLDTQGQSQLRAAAERSKLVALQNKGNHNGNNGNAANGNNKNGNNGNAANGHDKIGNNGGSNAGNGGRNANNGGGNAGNGGATNVGTSINAGISTAPAAVQTAPSNPGQVATAVATAAPVVVVPTAPTAAPPSVPGSFKALALAWNQSGGWVVRMADALPAANDDAVTTCNGQFGGCQQVATVDSSAFGCLAIMSNGEHQLFSATGTTLEAVTASLEQQLESRGEKGELVYSGCNNS